MKKKKVVCLVQLPPPVHGAAIMNQRVVLALENSVCFDSTALKLNYATSFHEMHAPVFKKLFYALSLLLSLLKVYIFCRPAITYIAFSPFGLGFYRDFFFVVLARCFSSRPFLHLHGTGLSNNRSKFKTTLLRWMFSKSKLLLISSSLYRDVEQYTTQLRTVVINNCVDDPGEQVRTRPQTVRILYLANLDERKGVKVAISVFSKLRALGYSAKLTIAGADTALLSAVALEEFIRNKYPHLISEISIYGPAYGADKNALFVGSDIFLYPSMHDAAPLVVLEALSYGLPVICSAQGALSEMVTNGESGFVSEGLSTDEYAANVALCIENLDAYSSAARRSYLDRFSPLSFEDKVEHIFLCCEDG